MVSANAIVPNITAGLAAGIGTAPATTNIPLAANPEPARVIALRAPAAPAQLERSARIFSTAAPRLLSLPAGDGCELAPSEDPPKIAEPRTNGRRYKGRILKSASFCDETGAVQSMSGQVDRGRSVDIYDLAVQGMVDYGRGHTPLPRIWLVYRDGRRVECDGVSIESEGLCSIEFANGGPGFSPDHVFLYMHGGGSATHGQHGQGMSIAHTYEATQGITVEIESHWQGQAWRGKTRLADVETQIARALQSDRF